MTDVIALIVWLVLLALAVPYVRRAKHPRAKTLAATMLFVLLFFLVSSALFFGFSRLLVALGRDDALDSAGWASVFLALVFVPAFLFARWMIKRPPWDRPAPK